MATPNIPEMIKITLNTSGLQDINPNTNQPLGTFRGALKNLDTDLRAFERALQSATNGFELFNNSLKKIDPKTGLAEQSFFVKKEEFDNAMAALKAKSAELAARRGGDYGIDVSPVENFNTTFKVYGKRAQRKAMEGIDRLGGVAVVNASDPDKLDISVPLEAAAVAGMTQSQKRALVEKAIPEAAKLSQIEKDKRDKEREEREAKENEREREKEGAESAKKAMVVRKALLAVVTVIADLTRRILTATLKQAAYNDRMAVEAHAVGVTSMERRGFDIFDIAHGMEKGTTFGAIQSVQGMFGDITRLDENALKTLARVMGGEISALVMSGQGGKNPDQLLNKILDKYFKQYLSGKNSLGQSVGMEQARRELITSLQSVSPEIAKLFARMVEDYVSGAYGPFDDSAGWMKSTRTNRSGLMAAELKYSEELGKRYNEILAVVEDLKTSFFTRLMLAMDDLLAKVRNWRIGQSASEKIAEDESNRAKSEKAERIMQEQNRLFSSGAQDTVNRIASIESTPIGKGYTVGQAKGFKYTLQDLAGIKLGLYKAKDYEGKYGNEAKAYVARAMDIFDNLIFNPEVNDELARIMVNMERLNKIEKQKGYKVGSGKIEDLSMTEIERSGRALELLEKYMGEASDVYATGSEFNDMVALAYTNYLKKNPAAFEEAKKKMDFQTRVTYQGNLKRMAARKGVKIGDLSEEEQMAAFVEADKLRWYKNFFDKRTMIKTLFGGDEGAALQFYRQAGMNMINESIDKADSKILGLLSQQDAVFRPNAAYTLSGKQGQSGEYVLTLQFMNERGEKESRSFTFADTQGAVGNFGRVVMDRYGRPLHYESGTQNRMSSAE